KIFCSPYCKSSYHHKKNRGKKQSFYIAIDKQLKLNRQLLSHFNKAGKAVIRKDELLKVGFNPKYFTHYWKNKKGNVYLYNGKIIWRNKLKSKKNGRLTKPPILLYIFYKI
ncbi:MAG: hypothetical protein QMB65_02070, partial [Vicingaceae bacterium]